MSESSLFSVRLGQAFCWYQFPGHYPGQHQDQSHSSVVGPGSVYQVQGPVFDFQALSQAHWSRFGQGSVQELVTLEVLHLFFANALNKM